MAEAPDAILPGSHVVRVDCHELPARFQALTLERVRNTSTGASVMPVLFAIRARRMCESLTDRKPCTPAFSPPYSRLTEGEKSSRV
jgi:hypothetical protein